jgi:hypothetical protein
VAIISKLKLTGIKKRPPWAKREYWKPGNRSGKSRVASFMIIFEKNITTEMAKAKS